jgi:hypothetical protein
VKIPWGRLASQLGVAYWLAGLVLVFLGWNGAASWNSVPAQIPYLISGGLAGLCLVVIGAAVVIVQNARADRAALQSTLLELQQVLGRAQGGGADGAAAAGAAAGSGAARPSVGEAVVAGPSSFHRPSCRLIEGQSGLRTLSVAAATSEGLTPCRACDPAGATTTTTTTTA